MTDIPKEALEKANEVLREQGQGSWFVGNTDYIPLRALARFIADVSEKAREAVEQSTFAGQLPAHIAPLQSLILPDPESDLLKEAREICARVAEERVGLGMVENYRDGTFDDGLPVLCTLAALKGRK